MTMIPTERRFKRVIAFEVSKHSLVVHRLPEDEQVTIANEGRAIARLLARWQAGAPVLVVCEATGGYERHVLEAAEAAGLTLHRAHGSRVRAFARYLGHRAKTDPLDARLIARYGLETPGLRLYSPPPPEQAALRALRGRRDEIAVMARMEENRLEQAVHERVRRSLATQLAALTAELAALEREIAALIAADDRLARRAALMQSVKGIGPKTAAAILAYLPELGTLSRGGAAALVGLAPYADDSGRQRGVRHVAGGRADARKSLYMAAVVAMTHNPAIRDWASSLRQRGKPPKLVITAVMRKLIVVLNAILREEKPCRLNQQP